MQTQTQNGHQFPSTAGIIFLVIIGAIAFGVVGISTVYSRVPAMTERYHRLEK